MASQWFYVRDGKKHGPFSSTQLREMAASGDLLPTDLVRKEGMSGWRKAGESPKLFQNAVLPQPHEPQQLSPDDEAPSRNRFATLKEQARDAVHAAGLAAEKTKLLTVTLPAAYVELGQNCFETRSAEKHFPKEMADLDRLAVEGPKAFPAAAPASLTERVKSIASKGIEVAQKQKATVERNLILGRLGKKAFERFGESAGPPQISSLIARSLVRLDELDAKLAESAGAIARPRLSKKLLFGGLASAGCVAVLALGVGLLPTSRQSGEQGNAAVAPPETVPMIPTATSSADLPAPSVETVRQGEPQEEQIRSNKQAAGVPPMQEASAQVGQEQAREPTSTKREKPTPNIPIFTAPENTIPLPVSYVRRIAWDDTPNSFVLTNDLPLHKFLLVFDAITGKLRFPIPEQHPAPSLVKNSHVHQELGRDGLGGYVRYAEGGTAALLAHYVRGRKFMGRDLATDRKPSLTILKDGYCVVSGYYGGSINQQALSFCGSEDTSPLAIELPAALERHLLPLREVVQKQYDTEAQYKKNAQRPLLLEGKSIPSSKWTVIPGTNKILLELSGSTPGAQYFDKAKTNRHTLAICEVKDSGVTVSQAGIPAEVLKVYESEPSEVTDFVSSADGSKISVRLMCEDRRWGEDKYLCFMWDLNEPQQCAVVREGDDGEKVVAFSPDGYQVLCDGTKVLQSLDGAVVAADVHKYDVQEGCGWAMDGSVIVTRQNSLGVKEYARHEDDVFLRNAETLEPIARLRNLHMWKSTPENELKEDKAICISPDGKKIAVVVRGPGYENQRANDQVLVRVWDLPTILKAVQERP